jgi:hypothetical protein
MLLLGDVPRQDLGYRVPARLHMHKGQLDAYPWMGEAYSDERGTCFADGGEEVANDAGDVIDNPHRWLLDGFEVNRMPRKMLRALGAAREARFEHGQRGAA